MSVCFYIWNAGRQSLNLNDMKRTWYLSLLLAFALGGSLPGYGQTATSSAGEGSEPEQVSAPIYFRLGKSAVDPTFMDNRRQMELFVGTLREILSNPDYVVNRVRVVGMASAGRVARAQPGAGRSPRAVAGRFSDPRDGDLRREDRRGQRR